ncbi:MAG: hypothetical protein IPP60_08230 [Sphingobacteriales bacterium]|nr:hypothetical protein [Sphingobacteriales bacterium]
MDKATFILHYNQVPNSDFLQEIPEYITDFEEHRNSRGIYITGKIGNLFVTANEFYITVGRASLCKYYYSNNIENMSIIDVKNAIVKLSDELHLPIDIATVCKFEYGITLITDYSPQDYFPLLGNMPFRSRLEQDYGLYYKEKSNNTQYVCYDKLAECKRNKEIIPMKFNDVQLLRLEIRYNKNLAKHFNCERVLVSQLYDPLFFNSVHDEWF